MKKYYQIEGMTCERCRSGIENILKEIPEVTQVAVNLEHKEAVVTTKKLLNIEVFKRALPETYNITEKDTGNFPETHNAFVKEKSELQQLFPLFLIFGYITIASVLLNYNSWNVSEFMLDFMGLFYVVFSFFKILDLKGFPKSFRMYDPLAKAIPMYGWVYPFIETVLALMFLMRFRIDIALIVTVLILSITTIGVTKVLLDKKNIQCACLGTALKLPMTKATFIENTIMLVMAVWMLLKMYS
ncbi:heavy-metal-associated domain-containing protein [Aquimarina sp. 2201CG14-23]|uniref:heavy-metal-associated domain-containing protein n=1 Tax=Aquimarina mycalae TaxID=3040073 RepID=UPI002477FF21|nr:heavy-metal-associated domain-containing protein [Aquimarina sp. 2201CG14-23]MDH7447886.1 heavy-metal-associated domain-containing protein [Aquimarina sp. 2201CG14-23]